MARRYVNCSCCNKKIYEGEECRVDKSHIGIFCSLFCWASYYGISFTNRSILDDNLLENDGSMEFKEESNE